MSSECNACYMASAQPEWIARIVANMRVDRPCARHAEVSDE